MHDKTALGGSCRAWRTTPTNTLRVLGGDLRIEDNPALEGLVGFRYLGTLGGVLKVALSS